MNGWSSDPAENSGDADWDDEGPVLERVRYGDGLFVGQGGMGTLHSVEDRQLGRVVARKVVRDPLPGAEARLLREARLTARLEHPGVVPIYDVGRLPDGRLYYTMRLIAGQTLGAALPGLPAARALRHLLAVCRTVAYAHSLGIVHRDLKPDNVLVGGFGETQVADWGLAFDLEDPSSTHGAGGTPGWQSPEQARGDGVDRRSDVWALGAMLRTVHVEDPALLAIVERAQQPLPPDRYPDAGALADDLEAFLDGRRVAAYRYSSWELLRRASWAWRVPLALVGTVVFAGLGSMAVITQRTGEQRDRAVAAERRAVDARVQAERAEATALLGVALTALAQDDRPEAELAAVRSLELVDSPAARGVLAAWFGIPRPAATVLQADLACDRVDLVGPELACIRDGHTQIGGQTLTDVAGVYPLVDGSLAVMERADRVRRISGSGGVELPGIFRGSLDVAPDRLEVLRVGQGRYRLLDLAAGTDRVLKPCVGSLTQVGALGPSDQLWAVCSDGQVLRGNPGGFVQHGRIRPALGIASSAVSIGDSVVVGTLHGWLADGAGHELALFDGGIERIVPAPDARQALVIRAGGEAAVVDLRTWRLSTRLPGRITTGHWLPDGTLRTAGDHLIDWGALATTRGIRYPGPEGVSALAHSDGRVAIGRGDGSLEVVELASGAVRYAQDAHTGVLKDLAFEPAGQRLLFHGLDPATLSVLEGTSVQSWPIQPSSRVAWLRDTLVWTPYSSGPWRGPPGGPYEQLPSARYVDVAALPDASAALLLDRAGGVFRLEPTGEPSELGRFPGAIRVAPLPDGFVVLTPHRIAKVRAGVLTWLELGSEEAVGVASSFDGSLLAVGLLDGRVRIVDPEGGLLAVLQAHRERVASLCFGEGHTLLTGSWDGSVRRWDLGVLDATPAQLAADIRAAWAAGVDPILITPAHSSPSRPASLRP